MIPLAVSAPIWSSSLDDLDPAFRVQVEAVISRLGQPPSISCSFRSSEVQDLLVSVGTATRAKGGQSCHNRMVDGKPAALAVDLWAAPLDLPLILGRPDRLAAEVAFLRRLGAAAHAEGLRWGGDWFGQSSVWEPWGLGWDPAHLERPGCASLRTESL